MSHIIAVTNQKGGVGKTTTSVNLSAGLALQNKRVLLIDFDPQADSSRSLGIDVSILENCIFDVLTENVAIKDIVRKTSISNLDIAPSKLRLANIDFVYNGDEESYFSLKKSLEKSLDDYDYIIIDCPPSLGVLTLNALVAANTVLVPIQCEYFALKAVSQILSAVSRIQSYYNPELGIEGFLLTMYEANTLLCNDVEQEVRSLFKENTFSVQIPRTISLAEAASKGLSIFSFRPTSRGASSYMALAREIIDKNERN